MKLEIVKSKLLYAINACERVAGKHVSLPVLSCILLEAKGNELRVKATNLDVGIEISVQAKISEEGVVAVSGGVIKSFLTNSFGDFPTKAAARSIFMPCSSTPVKKNVFFPFWR